MGRYKVQLDIGSSPHLTSFYGFEWALIGNLGVDLLVIRCQPFSAWSWREADRPGHPALTVTASLGAKEVHGQVPPTALFALPFAFGHPFQFGLSIPPCRWRSPFSLSRFG
jgi:hypothetical protein